MYIDSIDESGSALLFCIDLFRIYKELNMDRAQKSKLCLKQEKGRIMKKLQEQLLQIRINHR